MVVFKVAWLNLEEFPRGWRKQHYFLVPCCWITLNFNRANQTLTTHNASQHCHARFYAFVRQPLSKQLYYVTKHANPYSPKGTTCRVQLHHDPKCQAKVVRNVDNTIQRIVRFVSWTLSDWIAIYPVDQALSSLQTTGARFISLLNFERICGTHSNRNKPFTKTSLESYRLVWIRPQLL